MPPIPIDLDLEEDECWDRVSQNLTNFKEDETAKRLYQLERVLSEVIGHLKVLSQQIAVTQTRN